MSLAKYIGSVFVCASVLLSLPTSAQSSSPQPPNDRSQLKQIFDQASANLLTIQRLLDARNYQSALTESKRSLDDVRIKSGIHPKASYREKIAIPDGTLNPSFRSLGNTIKDLSIEAQDTIALSVANHRGGYFLDILNLMKRTNLLYLQALQGQLKSQGKLLAEDVAKIRHDIQDVQAIPLYLKDTRAGALFLVFDYEIANNDQAYLFNRELKTYLLKEGRALGIKSESQIDQLLREHVEQVRGDYLRSFSNAGSVQPQITTSTVSSGADIFTSPNFLKCRDYYVVYAADGPEATTKCLSLAPSYNFLKPGFSKCVDMYSVYSADVPDATDKCRSILK